MKIRTDAKAFVFANANRFSIYDNITQYVSNIINK